MAKNVYSDRYLHCPTCKESSMVRSWRWNNYHCPRCGEYDACFRTSDRLDSGTFPALKTNAG